MKIKPSDLQKKKQLPDSLLIAREGLLSIYYSPFRLPSKKDSTRARIALIGITPGTHQAWEAIETFRDKNFQNSDLRKKASFAGPMRINLIKYLDEIRLHKALEINSCESLFDSNSDLMLGTSLIRYPVYFKDKNYSGHNPKIESSDFLKFAIKQTFSQFLEVVSNDVLIIPLGKAVESGIKIMKKEFPELEKQVLWGFPHPSGSNAHAHQQLKENKSSLIFKIHKFF